MIFDNFDEPEEPILRSASTMNVRAALALQGELMVRGTSEIADVLCELLRSGEVIEPEVRELIAVALEQGRGGYKPKPGDRRHVVGMTIQNYGPNAHLHKAVAVRKNWVRAVERLKFLKHNGASNEAAYAEIRDRFDIGIDLMKKHAQPFCDQMEKDFHNSEHLTHEKVRSFGFRKHDPDYIPCFKSLYIDHHAAIKSGVSDEPH